MICPHCHKKITSITVDQVWNGSAYIDSDGEIEIEQEQCMPGLDKSIRCHVNFPRYYCGECGHFLTDDDDVVKKALKEAEE